MTINWPRFVEIIRTHQRFLLTSHIRPDCDALGSELGMAGVLEHLGKTVRIVNGHATPPNLAFIDPLKRIQVIGRDVQLSDLNDIDVLMVLDTSAWAQLGPMGDVLKATKAKKIILDHHESDDDLGAEAFKNKLSEATGRLVTEAAGHLNVPLTPAIAAPLFAALATDTGWFRFNSVNPGTYQTAAQLTQAGAVPSRIFNDLYEQDTVGRVRLRGRILSRVEVEEHGRLVYTHVLANDFPETGALASDTEDAINLTMAIAGTQVAAIFIEQPDGGVKISLRSRCAVDCSKLAEQFGGGGHKAAAGIFLKLPLHEAKTRVLDLVRAAMR